ncbi:MAG TPA: hypothetical protein PL041_10150 [Melioribacteraceae bacterium]|nr:hypothetical protein [Melioribacteraceae bacterium]
MKKNMVYFILYVVLITELLIVITERDELDDAQEAVRKEMLKTIYKDEVQLKVANSTDFEIKQGNKFNVMITASGLVSEQEKINVKYTIEVSPNSKVRPSAFPEKLDTESIPGNFVLQKDSTGNAIFIGSFEREGDYVFVVYAEVKRVAPSYMKEIPGLVEEFNTMMLEEKKLDVKTKLETFVIHAKALGGVKKAEAEYRF